MTCQAAVQRLEAERLRAAPRRDPAGEALRELIALLARAAADAGWYKTSDLENP